MIIIGHNQLIEEITEVLAAVVFTRHSRRPPTKWSVASEK